MYLVGLAAVLLRKRLLPRIRPRPWLAAAASTLLGTLFLSVVLAALPNNGEYLGHIRSGLYVPGDAWGWDRAAAQFLAVVATLAAVATGLLPRAHVGRLSPAPPEG